jgi:hypothetical protein
VACLAGQAGVWDDFGMQGFERMDGGLLDTAVGQLVPAGSMFAFLAAHRAEVFPDADYADLFAPPGVGRPSLSATRMAALDLHRACAYGGSNGWALSETTTRSE